MLFRRWVIALKTFGDAWRLVRLHASQAPFGLVREWTQSAFSELAERRPWLWAMVEDRLAILAERSLTVTFTQGSKTITSAAAFLAADVGRQIRVGSLPVYTITAVDAGLSSATLDIAYAATGGAATAAIFTGYVTMPADFGAFLLVADVSNQRQVSYWYTQADLGLIDPGRTSSGTPLRALVATTMSPVPATAGQARYELWPRATSAAQYPCWYRKRPDALTDDTVLPGVLQQRGDILRLGALAQCALWPGTPEHANPYFNLGTHNRLQDQFEDACAILELRDDDQAQQTWQTLPYHGWPVWELNWGDTAYLRSHDATISDYY